MRERAPCPACGELVAPGDRFCRHCGDVLEGSAPSATPEHEPVTAPLPRAGTESCAIGDLVGGRYRVLTYLDGGGFGSVFEAEDTRLDRRVALKVLRPGEERERFLREARILARLDHPNIVTVYDTGMEGSCVYLAMERVEGETLDSRLKRTGLGWEDVVRIGAEVAAALDHAHGKGVLHRDIKPSNILLTGDGAVKVADFGTAKVKGQDSLTSRGTVFGTVEYMAPECFREEELDGRADLYSLGVVLYEALTGKVPFEAPSVEALITKVLQDRPAAPTRLRDDLPDDVEHVVLRCLAKRAVERPTRARTLEVELRRIVEPELPAPRRPSVPVRLLASSVRPPEEGERRRIVLLQVQEGHLEGLIEEWTAERIGKLRDAMLEEMVEIVESHGGLLEDLGEDSVRVVFGLPQARESDAERALACGEEILRSIHRSELDGTTLSLSCAVHTGLGVASAGQERYRLHGETSRTVERLADRAQEGQLLVSGGIVERLRSRARFHLFDRIGVGSGAKQHDVYRVELSAAEARVTPPRAPMVGRQHELNLVLDAAQGAVKGRGVLLSIEGPAGVGKTRLVQEATQQLREGEPSFLVAACEAREFGGGGPYQPFRELLTRLVTVAPLAEAAERALSPPERALLLAQRDATWDDESVRHLDRDERQLGLRAAWSRLLHALSEKQPVALVIECAHRSDEPSRELLAQVAASCANARVLVIVTQRPEIQPPWVGKPYHRALILGSLSPEEEVELIRSLLGTQEVPTALEEALSERSEGIPLYIQELLRTFLDRGIVRKEGSSVQLVGDPTQVTGPATLEGVLAARVDSLEPNDRRILQIGSVLGREATLPLLSLVLEEPEKLVNRHLLDLLDRGFLVESPAGPEPAYEFHHPLLREVVYEGILRGHRRELHRRVAEALEAIHAGPLEEIADLLGGHYARSDSPELAPAHLLVATNQMRYAGDFASALANAEEGLRIVAREGTAAGGDRMTCRLLLNSAQVRIELGDPDRASDDVRSALGIAENLGELDLEGKAYHALVLILSGTERHEEALEYCTAGLELARKLDDPDLASTLDISRINSLTFLGRTQEAEELLIALEDQDHLSLRSQLGLLRMRAFLLYNKGRTRAALECVEEGLHLAEEAGERVQQCRFLEHKMGTLIGLARYREAVEVAEALIRLGEEMGARRARVEAQSLRAYALLQTGQLEASEAAARETEVLAEEGSQPWRRVGALRTRALVLCEWARYGEARALLKEALCLDRELGGTWEEADCLLGLAEVDIRLGRSEQAQRELEEVEEKTASWSDPSYRCAAGRFRLSIMRLAGRSAEAQDSYRKLEGTARDSEELETLLPVLTEGSLLASECGETQRAIELAEEVVRLSSESERRLDHLRGRLARAEAMRAEGKAETAAEEANAVKTGARELGVPGLEWRAWLTLARSLRDVGDSAWREAAGSGWEVVEGIAGRLEPDMRQGYLARSDRAELGRLAGAGLGVAVEDE